MHTNHKPSRAKEQKNELLYQVGVGFGYLLRVIVFVFLECFLVFEISDLKKGKKENKKSKQKTWKNLLSKLNLEEMFVVVIVVIVFI